MGRFVAIIGLAAGVAIAGGVSPLGPRVHSDGEEGHVHHAHTHWHDGHAHTHWHSHGVQHIDSQPDSEEDHHQEFDEHNHGDLPDFPPIARWSQVKDSTGKIRVLIQSGAQLVWAEPPLLPPPKPPPRLAGDQGCLPQLRTVILLT